MDLEVQSYNLGHLGIVAGIFDALKLEEVIDRILPKQAPGYSEESDMKADNLSRRLAKLEEDREEDMVTVTHQWLNEDGTPASEMIEHWIPRSRTFKFKWIDEK